MTETIRNCVGRLERALGVAEGLPSINLAALSADEIDAALAAAAAAPAGLSGGMVGMIPGAVPPGKVEVVEQALKLMQAALAIGWTRLGFQRETARYLDVALPLLLPSPRSPAAAAMAAALRAGELPLSVMQYVPVLAAGHPAPDGWRPS